MPLTLTEVHKYESIKGTTRSRLVGVHPAIGIFTASKMRYWLQDGKVFYEDGTELGTPPEDFWAEARKLTDTQRKEVGLVLPEDRGEAAAEASLKVWECDQCGETVPLSQKGVHIGRHRKQKKE